MKSLIEELKNNFKVVQKSTNEECFRVHTDWFDTYNKAVDAMIKLLKDKGYTEMVLPHLPVPYVCYDRDGSYRATVSIVK